MGGAGLDVLEQEPPTEARRELINHPHVVVTPHLGASTYDAQERVARNVAVQMCDIRAGGDFVGVVTAPNMNLARKYNLVPQVLLAERIGTRFLGLHPVVVVICLSKRRVFAGTIAWSSKGSQYHCELAWQSNCDS